VLKHSTWRRLLQKHGEEANSSDDTRKSPATTTQSFVVATNTERGSDGGTSSATKTDTAASAPVNKGADTPSPGELRGLAKLYEERRKNKKAHVPLAAPEGTLVPCGSLSNDGGEAPVTVCGQGAVQGKKGYQCSWVKLE